MNRSELSKLIVDLTRDGYEIAFEPSKERERSICVLVGRSPDGVMTVWREAEVTNECVDDAAIDSLVFAINKARSDLDDAMTPPTGVLNASAVKVLRTS